MDSAGKATNKAMSAAYKYLALLVFCIPTESTPDADQETHEVSATKPATKPDPKQPTLLTEAQVADWLAALSIAFADELPDIKSRALAIAEKAQDREAYATFRAAAAKRHEALTKKETA
jgi:hypothetical protein